MGEERGNFRGKRDKEWVSSGRCESVELRIGRGMRKRSKERVERDERREGRDKEGKRESKGG